MQADVNRDDVLSKDEFMAMTSLDSLNLDISKEHAGLMYEQTEAQGGGALSFKEFEPVFSKLIKESS